MKYLSKVAFRSIWVLIALVATAFTLIDHLTGLGGDGIPPVLFYTTWSVWLALLASVLAWILSVRSFVKKRECESKVVSFIEFCALIMMIATFIVSAFVLPDKIWTGAYWTASSTFKHFLLPVLTVIDALVYQKGKVYTAFYPLYGVLPSLAYWVTIVVRALVYRASCGGAIPEAEYDFYYPYGFTNFDTGHSVGGLCGMLAGILVGLIVIGYLFWLFNRRKTEN